MPSCRAGCSAERACRSCTPAAGEAAPLSAEFSARDLVLIEQDFILIRVEQNGVSRPTCLFIGFGFKWVSSEIRVPRPPARITAFIIASCSLIEKVPPHIAAA